MVTGQPFYEDDINLFFKNYSEVNGDLITIASSCLAFWSAINVNDGQNDCYSNKI